MTDVTRLFDRSAQQGRLEFTDRDRLDLLHRMSTNDLLALQPGQGTSTVLTTALARIIDRLIVYHRGETALAITNHADTVRKWLQKHIFFQDKVKIRDVSADLGQLEIHGPQASTVVETIAPGAGGLVLHHFIEAPFQAATLMVSRTYSISDDGFILIASMNGFADLKQQLSDYPGLQVGNDADYERLRIRAGMPGAGHELTEDYIPLEANLWDSVSFQKGCYIGQEIIARMESRHKLAKTLVGLKLDRDASTGMRLLMPDGGQSIGSLTSVAPLDTGSDDGKTIGLGFVKPDWATVGTRLEVPVEGASPIAAEVIALPLIHR